MTLFNVLQALHIAGGSFGLLLGSYVMAARKGGRSHRLIGNIYFAAMLTASLISLPMAWMHKSYFLFVVGVFTAYMLLTGRRYIAQQKRPGVRRTDWLLAALMLIFSAAFIYQGVYMLTKGEGFGTVLMVFGGISLLFVYQDSKNNSDRSHFRNYGLLTHIQRMVGSYIASLTAFLVVNNQVLHGIVAWLLPTAIFTPLILYWSRKFAVKKRPADKTGIV